MPPEGLVALEDEAGVEGEGEVWLELRLLLVDKLLQRQTLVESRGSLETIRNW